MRRIFAVMLVSLSMLLSAGAPAFAAPEPFKSESQAVRYPAALALLARAQQNELTNLDVVLVQQNVVEIEGGPVIPYELEIQQTIRGTELLQFTTIRVPALGEEQSFLSAVREGRTFLFDGTVWMEQAQAVPEVSLEGIDTIDSLIGSVVDARLGGFRWVDGSPQRDVEITFEPALMEPVMGAIMATVAPQIGMAGVDVTWERLNATFTVDLPSGRVVASGMDAAARMVMNDATGAQVGMRITVQQQGRFAPGYSKISWPDGMPQ